MSNGDMYAGTEVEKSAPNEATKSQAKRVQAVAGDSGLNVATTPVNNAAPQAVGQMPLAAPKVNDFTQNPAYVPKNRGVEVEPGQDWRHLSAQQRQAYFMNHENRWKEKHGLGGSSDMKPQQTWTRG